MTRHKKIEDLKLKKEMERVLAFLKAKPLKGKIVCIRGQHEWPAIMSLNERDKIPNGHLWCHFCEKSHAWFWEDYWKTSDKL